MKNITKKSYSPAFKTRVVKEILGQEKTVSQICSEYKIHPTQAHEWRKKGIIQMQEGFKNPLQYLALTEILDCSQKLPTALHIVSGAMKYLQAMDSILGSEKITHVGLESGRPRIMNGLNIADLRAISNSFFQGFNVGDINPDMRTTKY